MKITKRQLRQIISEATMGFTGVGFGPINQRTIEKSATFFGNAKLYEQEMSGRSPGDVIEAVKDAVMRGFMEQGEVFTNDIFDRLGAEGYSDMEIDSALDQLADQYL